MNRILIVIAILAPAISESWNSLTVTKTGFCTSPKWEAVCRSDAIIRKEKTGTTFWNALSSSRSWRHSLHKQPTRDLNLLVQVCPATQSRRWAYWKLLTAQLHQPSETDHTHGMDDMEQCIMMIVNLILLIAYLHWSAWSLHLEDNDEVPLKCIWGVYIYIYPFLSDVPLSKGPIHYNSGEELPMSNNNANI